MFNPFRPEDPALDEAIAEVLQDMKGNSSYEDEYQKSVDQLTKLYALKPKKIENVDPNTLITVAANVFLGIAVLRFEDTGVVTSKLWTFLKKN